MADDKAAALHVVVVVVDVDVDIGALLGAPLGSSKLPPTTKNGPSWEGMAADSNGNYYLVGSHSGKSDEERAPSSVVVRFRLRSGDPPAIEDASVVRWNIAGPLEAALRAEGLDAVRVAEREVGGLAVRESGGRRELVIGLKKPDDKVRAFAADITDAPSPDATLGLRRTFAFDAGRREGIAPQLTSIKLLITYDNDPHATKLPSRFQTALLVHPRD